MNLVAALIAAGSLLALPPADGGGTYIATGDKYEFVLANSGSLAWRSFALVAPPGLAFVGGTTGNEGSATCVVGPPTQITCGPLAPGVVPPQGRIAFVATMSAPAVCGLTFELRVSSTDGVAPTRAADVAARPDCAQQDAPRALAPPALRGRPSVGGRLHATAPEWSSAPTRVHYRWERCTRSRCTTIAGTTGLVLVLTKRDAGHAVRLVVTATIAGEAVGSVSRRVAVRS